MTQDECLNCDGTGKLHGVNPCRACKGTGVIPSREPSALDVEVRADTSSGLPGGDSQKAACTLASKDIVCTYRKIVQIAAMPVANTAGTQCDYFIYALCDDGSMWEMPNTRDWSRVDTRTVTTTKLESGI